MLFLFGCHNIPGNLSVLLRKKYKNLSVWHRNITPIPEAKSHRAKTVSKRTQGKIRSFGQIESEGLIKNLPVTECSNSKKQARKF